MPEGGPGQADVKGRQYLKNSAQFSLVYEKGRSWATDLLVMKALANGLDFARFGFSVSRRVGGAVVRNRLKRRLREIMRQAPVRPGWDVIYIVRPAASEASYPGLKKRVNDLLLRAKLLVGEHEGIGLKPD